MPGCAARHGLRVGFRIVARSGLRQTPDMERASAGEGNSPSPTQDPTTALEHRPDRDERCAYGQLVARELAALRERDDEWPEHQPLRARIRRWGIWPLGTGTFPAASRTTVTLGRILAPGEAC